MPNSTSRGTSTEQFANLRDALLAAREDPSAAASSWATTEFETFNWATDWFDEVARTDPDRAALIVLSAQSREERSYREMSERSVQVAGWLGASGCCRAIGCC